MEHRTGGILLSGWQEAWRGSLLHKLWAFLGLAWKESIFRSLLLAGGNFSMRAAQGSIFYRLYLGTRSLPAYWRDSATYRLVSWVGARASAQQPILAGSLFLQKAPLERLPVYLALLFPFLSTPTLTILVFLGVLLFLLGRLARGERLGPFRLPYTLFLLFLAFMAMATAASVLPRASLLSFVLWVTYGLLFAWTAQTFTFYPQALRTGLWAFLGGAFLVAVIALLQGWVGVDTSRWIDIDANPGLRTRVFSVFDDPNMLAAYLIPTQAAGLVLLLSERAVWAKGCALLLTGTVLAAQIETFSRGGWVATLVVLVILGGLWKPRYALFIWGAMALLVFGLFTLGPSAIQVRFQSLLGGGDTSIQYRFAIWQGAWQMAKAHLWTGVGLGPAAFALTYPAYMLAGTLAAHAHNIYLELWVEAGLPALLLFLVFAASMAVLLLRGSLRPLPLSQRLAAAGALAALVGLLVEGMVDNIWFSPRSAMALWWLLGAGLAAQEGKVPS
ncbi:MAG: O-antigen ligase family protein [Bacillota bacterium]|nr:O-antigen ligase family protein [Bacillota bacterium]